MDLRRLGIALVTAGGVSLALLLGSAPQPALAVVPLALTQTAAPPTPTNTPVPTNTPIPTSTNVPTATPTAKPRPPADPGVSDPLITKASNLKEARIGDEVIFTLEVTNRGPDTAQDVVVTDPLPSFLDVLEATASKGAVSASGRTVTVTIGQLKVGELVTITIRTRVNALALPPGDRNVATVTSSNDGDLSNNSGSVNVGIAGPTPTLTPLTDAAAQQLTATAAASAAGSVPPTPTPVPLPSRMPVTGAPATGADIGWLIAFGAMCLGAGIVLAERVRRSRRQQR